METTQKNREAPSRPRQADSPQRQSQPRKSRPEQTQRGQTRREQTRPEQTRSEQPAQPRQEQPPKQERRSRQEQPPKGRTAPEGQSRRGSGPARPQAAPGPRTHSGGAAVKEAKRTAAPAEQTDLSSGKKRAYGKSKPKKKSALTRMAESAAAAQKSRQQARAREERAPKSRRRPQAAPAVIYTEPKKFNRHRLLMQLLIVGAVVAALVLGVSVFFKVGQITVTGANVYTPWAVQDASGIQEGDSLLTFSRPRAGAQIKANLPYVKNVRFGIKLPDTVNIIIEEEDVVYAVKDSTGTWWLVNSEGRVVSQAAGRASSYTQILGFTLENPAPGTLAAATEAVPVATEATGPTVAPITTTGAQRLRVALEIVSALEDNDIVGDAASVDVSHLEDIIVWYGTRYQVNLGDSTRIDYKIACMQDVIQQLSEYQSGILDISFTIWPDRVIYTPFG